MPKYRVLRPYAGMLNGHTPVIWPAGAVVELDPADAAWVDRDTVGTTLAHVDTDPTGFSEDDEPTDKVAAAFESGDKGVTGRPPASDKPAAGKARRSRTRTRGAS